MYIALQTPTQPYHMAEKGHQPGTVCTVQGIWVTYIINAEIMNDS